MLRLTPRSVRIHAGFHEARATWEKRPADHARTATGPSPSAARHPIRFASHTVLSLPPSPPEARTHSPTTPRAQRPAPITRAWFGLIRFRSPLLTEYPFLQVLRCFTSLRTPPQKPAVPAHDGRRVAPFGDPRIEAMLEAPRGLSHPQTSFVGTVCQGIHHAPLRATQPTAVSSRGFPDSKIARRQIIALFK